MRIRMRCARLVRDIKYYEEAEEKIYAVLGEYECTRKEVWELGGSLIACAYRQLLDDTPGPALHDFKEMLLRKTKNTAKSLSKLIKSY